MDHRAFFKDFHVGGSKFKGDSYGIARIRRTMPNVTSKNIVDESDKFRFETKYVMVRVS